MPFLRKKSGSKNKKYEKKQKIKAALQVRLFDKRSALFSLKRAAVKASFSIEAALSVSLFIFAMVLLMLPFKMMDSARKMQSVCEAVNREVCKYAYLSYVLEEGSGEERIKKEGERIDQEREESAEDAEFFHALIGSGALGVYAAKRAEEMVNDRHVFGVSGMTTECMLDGEMIVIRLDYRYRLPFSAWGPGSIGQKAVSSRRAWIGSEGEEESGEGGEEEEETVYLGKTSTRYHRNRQCHYLYNDMQSLPLTAVSDHRNRQGGRYKPCARCGRAAAETVYILPSGSSYHTSRSCSAMLSYVRAVKLSEVEHLGACSYCGGSH